MLEKVRGKRVKGRMEAIMSRKVDRAEVSSILRKEGGTQISATFLSSLPDPTMEKGNYILCLVE